MASEFVPNSNPKEYNQVNHLNGIKSDNRAVNLQWCNNKINVQHAFDIGLNKGNEGETNPAATMDNSKAMSIIRIMATSSLSNREAAKMFGIPLGTLRKIKDGINWHILNNYRSYFH